MVDTFELEFGFDVNHEQAIARFLNNSAFIPTPISLLPCISPVFYVKLLKPTPRTIEVWTETKLERDFSCGKDQWKVGVKWTLTF